MKRNKNLENVVKAAIPLAILSVAANVYANGTDLSSSIPSVNEISYATKDFVSDSENYHALKKLAVVGGIFLGALGLVYLSNKNQQ